MAQSHWSRIKRIKIIWKSPVSQSCAADFHSHLLSWDPWIYLVSLIFNFLQILQLNTEFTNSTKINAKQKWDRSKIIFN